MKKLLFLVNDAHFFISHRVGIAEKARKEGYEVVVATADSRSVEKITALGFRHAIVPFSRSGQNLRQELLTLREIYNLFRREQPDLVHLVTIKPVIYGALIARLIGIKAVVAAVSGLGTVFVSNSLLSKMRLSLIKVLYTASFKHKNLTVIFQNPDDRRTLHHLTGLSLENTVLIRGSGVSLDKYLYIPENDGSVVVVMAARLLIDKGVREFVEAARILKQRGANVECRLVGSIDLGNTTSISQEELGAWIMEGAVKVLGYQQDVSLEYSAANIVCLPSYREGLPKGLIEAAACGRAVVTTDVPGCRDAITPDVTGLLVPVKDSNALADCIAMLADNPEVRHKMGQAGRKLAEDVFTVESVINRHISIYRELLYRAK